MNKYLHRILLLLIFTSVSAAVYLFSSSYKHSASPPTQTISPPQTTTEKLIPAILENKRTNPDTGAQTPQPAVAEKNKTTNPAPPTTPTNQSPEEISETIPITLVISNAPYQIQAPPSSTAYQVMDGLRQENKISFSTKNFSGLGYFVQEINGIKNNPSTGFYWTFYINNQEAKVGISNYIIKPNDTLTWKFENK